MLKALVLLVVALAVLWVAIPVARTYRLIDSPAPAGHLSAAPFPVRNARFLASDGVKLGGWYVPAPGSRVAVVLVPGFEGNRSGMIPYAQCLRGSGMSSLLYDSRGTGQSGGHFSLGIREVDDVLGAIRYLRTTLPSSERIGVLGVSLGSGDAIVAAARNGSVARIVADSPYANQLGTVERLNTLRLHGIDLPLAPISVWTAERLLGKSLASFSPLSAARRLPPRKLLLIHSRHDTNPTTPLKDALELLHAARPTASLWIAPSGGHAGAIAGQPKEYCRRVTSFFKRP